MEREHEVADKTLVFSLLKNNKVFMAIVPNGIKRRADAYYIIQRNNLAWSASMPTYDGLILNGYNYYRIFHNENEFAWGKLHVDGIECFWIYTKRSFVKFNSLTNVEFILHLKESEYRFNHKDDNFFRFIGCIFRRKL